MSRPVHFEIQIDDVGRAVPGTAWRGFSLDPEGNTSGIHQTDPSAA